MNINTNLADSRKQFPDFFTDWDTDPYKTFLKALRFQTYGFPNDGRDEWRTPLGITIDGLGISEYWVPTYTNPANVEFYHQFDECIARFIEETKITDQTEFDWFCFLHGICTGSYFQANILKWISENYRTAYKIASTSRLQNEILRCTIGAASLFRDRGQMFEWVLEKLMKAPQSNHHLILWLFRSPGSGKLDPKIMEFLPDMAIAHRRLLYLDYQRYRHLAHVGHLRIGYPECYKVHFKNRSSSFAWGIKEILFSIEHGYQKRQERNAYLERESEFAQKANRFMIEHSARCPFPLV